MSVKKEDPSLTSLIDCFVHLKQEFARPTQALRCVTILADKLSTCTDVEINIETASKFVARLADVLLMASARGGKKGVVNHVLFDNVFRILLDDRLLVTLTDEIIASAMSFPFPTVTRASEKTASRLSLPLYVYYARGRPACAEKLWFADSVRAAFDHVRAAASKRRPPYARFETEKLSLAVQLCLLSPSGVPDDVVMAAFRAFSYMSERVVEPEEVEHMWGVLLSCLRMLRKRGLRAAEVQTPWADRIVLASALVEDARSLTTLLSRVDAGAAANDIVLKCGDRASAFDIVLMHARTIAAALERSRNQNQNQNEQDVERIRVLRATVWEYVACMERCIRESGDVTTHVVSILKVALASIKQGGEAEIDIGLTRLTSLASTLCKVCIASSSMQDNCFKAGLNALVIQVAELIVSVTKNDYIYNYALGRFITIVSSLSDCKEIPSDVNQSPMVDETERHGMRFMCNNIECVNLEGPSDCELKTFSCGGAGGACGARYCSRECQVACWRKGHRCVL